MNQWEKGEKIEIPEVMMNIGSVDVNVPRVEKPTEPEFEQINMVVNHRYNPDGESTLCLLYTSRCV